MLDNFEYGGNIKVTGGVFPGINIRYFLKLARRNPAFYEATIKGAIRGGLLSPNQQGNFELTHSSGFFLNPSIANQHFFWTQKQDCNEYCRVIVRQGLTIVQHGEYAIPEQITPHDFAVMRVKCQSEHLVSEELRRKGILVGDYQGTFSVAYRPSSKQSRRYLNLTNPDFKKIDAFTTRELAELFARSIPIKSSKRHLIEIVEN